MKSPFQFCAALLFGLATSGYTLAQDADSEYKGARLSTIIIYTPQIRNLAEFYENALEFPPPATVQEDHIGYWLGQNYVGFEPVGETVKSPSGTTAWFAVDDIHKAYNRMEKLGATPDMAPTEQPWGGFHARLVDPDGNLFGLIQFQAVSTGSD